MIESVIINRTKFGMARSCLIDNEDTLTWLVLLSSYPNPADDHIFIKGTDDQALIDVLVMNEAGQLEQKTQLSYPFKLETSDLPSGVYTLLLLGAEGNNTSLKW